MLPVAYRLAGVVLGVLTRVEITDYQSLQRAEIPLGRLTVVTGPSNSGKSAVIRAIRLLAFNARGTAYIRTGAKSCKVVAGGESWVVGIVRSITRGKDAYRLANGGDPQTYTKLAGGVPDDITKALQLEDLNFAGQLDPPYLLTEAGTGIARTLGELTNVSMVFKAAAEAGRLRKGLVQELKAAQARLEALTAEAVQYRGIGERRRAVIQAEELAEAAREKGSRVQRLRVLAGRVRAEQAAVAQASQALADQAPPSLALAEELAARLARVRELIAERDQAQADVVRYRDRVSGAERAEQEAHDAVHEALAAAGQCPMCGQAVA